MAEKLEFDLTVKNNELNKALDDASNKSKSLGNSISTAVGVFAGGLALKGFELLGDAISSANRFAKESIKAFTEQEDAINRLGQALRASGDFSDQALSDLTAFGSELQKVSKFGDEVVVSQLAVAKSFGASNKVSKELVQAAANLSATFGGSLEENVQKLGKTLSGEAGRLSQFIPELKNLTKAQLEAGDAASIINQRFGGAAASELNTYSGSIIAASNAFSDLQEEVGGLIVETLNLSNKNNFLKGIYESLTQSVADYRIEQARQENGFRESDASVNQLSREYEELTEKIEKLEQKSKVLPGGLDSLDASKLQLYTKGLTDLEKQINSAIIDANAATRQANELSGNAGSGGLTEQQKVQIASEQVKNAELLALSQQFANDQALIDAQVNANKLLSVEEQQLALVEAQTNNALAENQRVFDLELEKNKLIKDAEEKRFADTKAGLTKNIADQRAIGSQSIANAKRLADEEKAVNQSRLQAASDVLAASASLAKQGSVAQKALLTSQAIINSYVAFSNALADTRPAAAAPFVAGAILATGLANVARINGVQFEKGGFVGGVNGASVGPDNTTASVRSGELILNAEQQSNLLRMINNGGSGGGDIIVQVDGREIARVVRDQVRSGFKIA